MKTNQLQSAEKLLNLKFKRKQSLIISLNAHEARLRAQMKQVVEKDEQIDQSANRDMQSIGADVIWKAWVGRTKETLNRELAQVLAQKEVLLADMRREYGKVLVARGLIEGEIKTLKKAKSKDFLSQATDYFLFH